MVHKIQVEMTESSNAIYVFSMAVYDVLYHFAKIKMLFSLYILMLRFSVESEEVEKLPA